MSHPSVYLAGPITGLDYKGCTSWREYAIKRLAEHEIKGWSPMRAKEYLAKLAKISGHGAEYCHMGAFATPRGVTTRDRFDCSRADVVLVNFLGAMSVSIGTVMEIAWADMRRIPVIAAINDDPDKNVHNHMMINECIGFRLPTLDEAIDVAIAILQ